MNSRPCSSKPLLLFDFGVILISLDKQRCMNALTKIGCAPIAQYVDEVKQEDLFARLEVGGDTETFCNEARKRSATTDSKGNTVPCQATDDEIVWAWNELLVTIPVDKLRLIKHLKDDMGYETAILSNTNWIHWRKSVSDFFTADGLTLDDYFDHVFLSCERGMVKPDPRLYDYVIQTTGRQAHDILFIDDSPRNLQGARDAGMRTFLDTTGTRWPHALTQTLLSAGRAAVIGNYDGVHVGHRFVLQELVSRARQRSLQPAVVTFRNHPLSVLRERFTPELLTTMAERDSMIRATLGQMGVSDTADSVQTVTFTPQMAHMSAHDFMRDVLYEQLQVRLLVLGYDSRFGRKDLGETFEDYVNYGREMGIDVVRATAYEHSGQRISSSMVRHLIKEGRMAEANECLGYTFSMSGSVTHGYGEGRKLGYPTANIVPPEEKIMPADGVYQTRVRVGEDLTVWRGVTNVGMRPTYHGTRRTVETHILGYGGDLYGQQLTVEFVRFIRPEQRFDSTDELRRQIEKDVAQTKAGKL